MPLLRDILAHPRFISGDITTKFLEEEYPQGFSTPVLNAEDGIAVVGAVVSSYLDSEARAHTLSSNEDAVYDRQEAGVDLAVTLGETVHEVTVGRVPVGQFDEDGSSDPESYGTFLIEHKDTGKQTIVRSLSAVGDPLMKSEINGIPHTFQYLARKPEGMQLRFKGSVHDILVRSRRAQELFSVIPEKPKVDMSAFVMTPMPGTVVSVAVVPGDMVAAGSEVAVVEAMKMQNSLRAERSGVIKSVRAAVGESLNDGDIIIEFEEETE